MCLVSNPAASAAYQAAMGDAAPKAKTGGGEGGGFAEALEEAARSAVDTLGKAETKSMQAAAGEADLLEVVSAVHDAESALRTVVAVRDKVVQSYQEILRMPV